MKKFIIGNDEKERIKFLYESKGIYLFEDSGWGAFIRNVKNLIGKSEDDFARLFRTTEVTLAKSIDDIVLNAAKRKSLTPIEDMQVKLMQVFNQSELPENIPQAQNQVKEFLNGYAKSKGKKNFDVIKDEILGSPATPKPQPQAATPKTPPQQKPDESDFARVWTNPIGAIKGNKLSGNRISNRSFAEDTDWASKIDWSKILNAKNMTQYDKIIANAIKSGDFKYVSSGGLEKLGITNFREFLRNNISKVNEVDPSTGRWSVIFK